MCVCVCVCGGGGGGGMVTRVVPVVTDNVAGLVELEM